MNKKLQNAVREQMSYLLQSSDHVRESTADPIDELLATKIKSEHTGESVQLLADNSLLAAAESSAAATTTTYSLQKLSSGEQLDLQQQLQFLEEKQFVLHNGETFLVQSAAPVASFSQNIGAVPRFVSNFLSREMSIANRG